MEFKCRGREHNKTAHVTRQRRPRREDGLAARLGSEWLRQALNQPGRLPHFIVNTLVAHTSGTLASGEGCGITPSSLVPFEQNDAPPAN